MAGTVTAARTGRAAALRAWADDVDPIDLRDAEADALRCIAELAETFAHDVVDRPEQLRP
jgi:hypothetical protein